MSYKVYPVVKTAETCTDYEVFVNPRDLSKAKGQSKSNIDYFSKLGYNIKITTSDDISKNDVLVKGCE